MNPIQTRLGFAIGPAEVTAGVNLSGRRIVVTAASSGIGVQTVRALASTGRRVEKGAKGIGLGGHIAGRRADRWVFSRWRAVGQVKALENQNKFCTTLEGKEKNHELRKCKH